MPVFKYEQLVVNTAEKKRVDVKEDHVPLHMYLYFTEPLTQMVLLFVKMKQTKFNHQRMRWEKGGQEQGRRGEWQ